MLIKYIGFALIFIIFLFIFADNNDFKGLPDDPSERLISIIYYIISTFTTTGYGDIYAKSSRARLVMGIFMLINFYFIVATYLRMKI
jgi:hypothetical protein